MNRRDFLRAAILTTIGLAAPLPNNPLAMLPTASKAARRFITFKITAEMLQDKMAFYSILDHELKRGNFNLDKEIPLALGISMEDADFAQQCYTVKLFIG